MTNLDKIKAEVLSILEEYKQRFPVIKKIEQTRKPLIKNSNR